MNLTKSAQPVEQKVQPAQNPVLAFRDLITAMLLYLEVGLFGAASLGWILPALQSSNFILPIVLVMVFFWISANAFVKKMPYRIRSATLRFGLYGLALFSLLTSGIGINGISFLFIFCIVTCLLNGLTSSLLALGLSTVTLAIAASLAFGGTIPQGVAPLPFIGWVYTIGIFDITCFTAEFILSKLVDKLKDSLTKSETLSREVEERRAAAEKDINQKTSDLERRLMQIRTAAEITRIINGELEQSALLKQVVDLIKERFNLYYVGLFLLDEKRENAVLAAGTGDAGERMLADRHQLPVGGNSMIGWSISFRRPRIALDVGEDAVRFKNPNLPLTRSEVALPLLARDNVLGSLSLQSSEPNAFDDDDVVSFQSIGDALAIAVENASLFAQTQNSLNEIRALHGQYMKEAWKQMNLIKGDLSYTFEQAGRAEEAGKEPVNQVSIPLVLRDQTIGDIVLDVDKKELTPEELTLVESISTQTALALENARLFEETQRRTQQEMTLNNLSAQFSLAIDIESILRTAVRELSQIPSVAEVSVQLGNAASAPEAALAGNNGQTLQDR